MKYQKLNKYNIRNWVVLLKLYQNEKLSKKEIKKQMRDCNSRMLEHILK